MTTKLVLEMVSDERAKQNEKWGEQNHHPLTYLAILGEEVGEANQAAVQAHFENRAWTDYAEELIHVAAVAVAMVESFYRTHVPQEATP